MIPPKNHGWFLGFFYLIIYGICEHIVLSCFKHYLRRFYIYAYIRLYMPFWSPIRRILTLIWDLFYHICLSQDHINFIEYCNTLNWRNGSEYTKLYNKQFLLCTAKKAKCLLFLSIPPIPPIKFIGGMKFDASSNWNCSVDIKRLPSFHLFH